jgi:hypothetical protein
MKPGILPARIIVGASLLAKAMDQSTSASDLKASSRAGSLPQDLVWIQVLIKKQPAL